MHTTAPAGESGWSIDVDSGDPQTLNFAYPQSDITAATKYIRPIIRLEMGARSADWPAVERQS